MNYSQEFLNAKLQAIRDCQAKADFKPAPQVIAAGKIKTKSKMKVKTNTEDISAAAKAKGIFKAKKLQKEQDEPRKFEIKTPDLTTKIPFKIDHKTTVYIHPDADREAIRAKYRNRFNKTPEDTMKEKLGYTYQF